MIWNYILLIYHFILQIFMRNFSMKVIINFGETKVVVPCGIDGDISIRELINLAAAKYSKLVRVSYYFY